MPWCLLYADAAGLPVGVAPQIALRLAKELASSFGSQRSCLPGLCSFCQDGSRGLTLRGAHWRWPTGGSGGGAACFPSELPIAAGGGGGWAGRAFVRGALQVLIPFCADASLGSSNRDQRNCSHGFLWRVSSISSIILPTITIYLAKSGSANLTLFSGEGVH